MGMAAADQDGPHAATAGEACTSSAGQCCAPTVGMPEPNDVQGCSWIITDGSSAACSSSSSSSNSRHGSRVSRPCKQEAPSQQPSRHAHASERVGRRKQSPTEDSWSQLFKEGEL